MIPADLEAIGRRVWGEDWKTPLARYVGVQYRTVVRWSDGSSSIPAGLADDLAPLADSGEAAYAYIEPPLAGVLSGGERIGHHPADLLAAGLGVILDGMREGAGIPATIELLRTTIRSLQAERDT